MNRIDLSDQSYLFYAEQWMPTGIADKMLQRLMSDVDWKQEVARTGHKFPRLTAYYADEGVEYSYSGVKHEAVPLPNYLNLLRFRVEEVDDDLFNSVLLNLYRNGQDSIGWHTDAEKELGENPVVASVSLGTTRTFQLRHKKGKKHGFHEFRLGHGSLLLMSGATQHEWLHSVPKEEGCDGERINLTFRNIR